jgi:hypothetical protein
VSVHCFLVVKASGDCRVTRRRPTLNYDEIAFPITVEFPPGWARVYDEYAMTIRIPEAQVVPPSIGAAVLPARGNIRRGGRRL